MATIDRPSPPESAAVGLGWPVEEVPEAAMAAGAVGLGWPLTQETLTADAAPRAGEQP